MAYDDWIHYDPTKPIDMKTNIRPWIMYPSISDVWDGELAVFDPNSTEGDDNTKLKELMEQYIETRKQKQTIYDKMRQRI